MARDHSPEAVASRKAFYKAYYLRSAILFAAFWAELLLVAAVRHGGEIPPALWNPLSFAGLIYHAGLMPGVNAWLFLVMTAVIFVTTVRLIPIWWLIPTALSFVPLFWWMRV